jgi:CRP-like cAMP-binding protein
VTDFISYCQGINRLNLQEAHALAEISEPVTVSRNEILQPIGHTCRTIYFINKGLGRIFYYLDDIEVTESFVFEHQIIARAESLFSGKPSRKGIQMLEDSELTGLSAHRLYLLYDTYPAIERLFRRIFEAAYVDTVNRVESLQFHTAETRYLDLLREMPDIVRRVPLKHIASYLGITPVTLSRIRASVR